MATVLIGAGLSVSAQQTISGSVHDFSSAGWNTSGEICLPCHTTHNVDSGNAPLWNHALTTATGFTPYDSSVSSTMDATVGQPTGVSLACLSCHDGTIALDQFGANPGSELISVNYAYANVTKNLANDHPVSFAYNTALATTDGGLHDPSTQSSGVGAGTIADDMLFAGSLECASCHDVHNNVPTGVTHLLLKANTGSALCLTCHNK